MTLSTQSNTILLKTVIVQCSIATMAIGACALWTSYTITVAVMLGSGIAIVNTATFFAVVRLGQKWMPTKLLLWLAIGETTKLFFAIAGLGIVFWKTTFPAGFILAAFTLIYLAHIVILAILSASSSTPSQVS